MEDLNARTESVIGNDDGENEDTKQTDARIAVGDPRVDDEPDDLRNEQPEESEPTPLEPDDPE